MSLIYGTQNNIINKLKDKTFNINNITCRVKDIILDEKHPLFKEYGEWNSIGMIFLEPSKNPIFNDKQSSMIAYPLFSNIKIYPLKNELVNIIYLTDIEVTNNTNSVKGYYLPPINVWNSTIHNGVPSFNPTPETQNKSYQQIELGLPNIIDENVSKIELGEYFNEELININPLLPYEGDIIYEGRFGNSIRFGSTTKKLNTWSTVGLNNSPITMIRNGQGKSIDESWKPVIEDVNNDESSIYLTSTQKIPISSSSYIVSSYKKSSPPEKINEYSSSGQIILNSGRLVFNSKKDSILFSSDKSIHLSANTSINFDAKEYMALATPKLYLGSSEGEEGIQLQSLVKGENLNDVLDEISSFLLLLGASFQTAIDSNGAPIISLQQISPKCKTLGQKIKNIVDSKKLLSQQVKTI